MPIDQATFTNAQISILLDGVVQTGDLTIASINAENTLFELTGIDSFIGTDGDYELAIDLTGIQAIDGGFGLTAQSVIVTIDTQAPSLTNLLRYIGGGLDAQHYTGADLNFNEDIMPLDFSAFTLLKDGDTLDISNTQINTVDPDWYQIDDFGQLTYPEGNYILQIDMAEVTDLTGNVGSGVEETAWTVDRTPDLTISGLEISPDMGYSPSDGITATTEFTVSFGINENASIIEIYQNDNGNLTLISTLNDVAAGAVDIPLIFETGGNTALEIVVTDADGNTTMATMDIYIDQSALTASWAFVDGGLGGQVLSAQPDTVILTFSDQLLDVSEVQNALVLFYNDNVIDASSLVINAISLTEFETTGLPTIGNEPGLYELGVDLTLLNKYKSGISGNDISFVSWEIEAPNNAIPIADAGQDTTLTALASYMLDGANSYDSDNDTLSFQWYSPDITLDDETSATPSFNVTSDLDGAELSFLLSVSDGIEFSTDIVTVTIAFVDCGYTYIVLCNDNDPCTENDVEILDEIDGSVCVPCAGDPIAICTLTTVQSCDDNDPCTENDVETIDDCDGSVCIPCAGDPIEICTLTTVQSCDDNDPCTENDVETIDDCDGSVCIPCAGEPIEICTLTTVQSCDDNDENTENDVETINNCDGEICIPCAGTLMDCPFTNQVDGTVSDGFYSASNTINSNATIIQNSNVGFRAGTSIELESGFTIENNVDFSATIGDCIDNNFIELVTYPSSVMQGKTYTVEVNYALDQDGVIQLLLLDDTRNFLVNEYIILTAGSGVQSFTFTMSETPSTSKNYLQARLLDSFWIELVPRIEEVVLPSF